MPEPKTKIPPHLILSDLNRVLLKLKGLEYYGVHIIVCPTCQKIPSKINIKTSKGLSCLLCAFKNELDYKTVSMMYRRYINSKFTNDRSSSKGYPEVKIVFDTTNEELTELILCQKS